MLHKIYGCIIAVVFIIVVFVGYQWLKAHDAWKDFQKDLAVSQEKEKQNKKEEVKATGVITTAQASNISIDNETKRKLANVQAQLNSKPDSEQIKAIIAAAIPALPVKSEKAADGSTKLYIDDTQENRDLINKHDADFKTCKFSLDDCQQKQANDKIIIDQQAAIIVLKQASIDQTEKDLKKATSFGKGGNIWARTGRVAFPIGCASLAAWGASQAKASPKVTGIASVSSGAVCAFKFHF
jgi:hypothetical protein